MERILDSFALFITVFVLGLLLLVAGLVAAAAYGPVRWECRNVAHNIGVPYQWSFTGGCLYKIDGRWVPSDQYRVTRNEKP